MAQLGHRPGNSELSSQMAQERGAAPGLSISGGALGPWVAATPWLIVPRSHDQDPQGKASKCHLGHCFRSGETESAAPLKLAVLGFKNHTAGLGGARSCLQRLQCCLAARANNKSTHRPQNLCDKFRATKRIMGKSPLSPSQE